MTDDLPMPSAGSLLRIGSPRVKVYTADQMREFATIAVLAEREACAKVCDAFESDADPDAGAVLAKAIRSRGQAPAQPADHFDSAGKVIATVNREQHIALREGLANGSSDAYFEANPTHDNDVGRMLFDRGFVRGFDAHEIATRCHPLQDAEKQRKEPNHDNSSK